MKDGRIEVERLRWWEVEGKPLKAEWENRLIGLIRLTELIG
jgi:hypothetical protein